MLDTNLINARQKLAAVNQLEIWRRNEVIHLLFPEPAFVEAVAGRSAQRTAKAGEYVRTNSARITDADREQFMAIEHAIFPGGAQTASQRNDVEIVYQAWDWYHVLVTNDGASKSQPGGILGAATRLAELGVTVMRPGDAVAHVKVRIADRDRRVESNCDATGTRYPRWLYQD